MIIGLTKLPPMVEIGGLDISCDPVIESQELVILDLVYFMLLTPSVFPDSICLG